jgi:hypothetical protein
MGGCDHFNQGMGFALQDLNAGQKSKKLDV